MIGFEELINNRICNQYLRRRKQKRKRNPRNRARRDRQQVLVLMFRVNIRRNII